MTRYRRTARTASATPPGVSICGRRPLIGVPGQPRPGSARLFAGRVWPCRRRGPGGSDGPRQQRV